MRPSLCRGVLLILSAVARAEGIDSQLDNFGSLLSAPTATIHPVRNVDVAAVCCGVVLLRKSAFKLGNSTFLQRIVTLSDRSRAEVSTSISLKVSLSYFLACFTPSRFWLSHVAMRWLRARLPCPVTDIALQDTYIGAVEVFPGCYTAEAKRRIGELAIQRQPRHSALTVGCLRKLLR